MVRLQERFAKSVLTRSQIPGVDYCVNPYTGCMHACRYCYADFMKRFTGHKEKWGSFVDAKVNAPGVLAKELKKKREGNVMISSVTDPYQPAEKRYRITRGCLEVLIPSRFSVQILTKSPLVLRDLDLLRKFDDIAVGITVTTDDDGVRKVFEPGAPPIEERIEALKKLRAAGVSTYAFVGPVLPMNPEQVAAAIGPHVESVLIDRMNYTGKTAGLYRSRKLTLWLDDDFIHDVMGRLAAAFDGIPVELC